MKTRHFLSLLAGIIACASPLRAEAAPLLVSAAISLGDALKEIDGLYEARTGTKVELNLGGSNALARQIEAGAKADVFFSADLPTLEGLNNKGLIDPASVDRQLSNRLTIVVPNTSSLSISSAQDITKLSKIALGDPKAVPAGVYTRTWLEKLGLWEQISPKVIGTENVRAALAAVESGNVDAAAVYKTDAAISKKVKIAYEVPVEQTQPIIYPVATVKGTANAQEAKRYISFLNGKEASAVFEKFGFIVLPDSANPGH
jgi:molybdate transport system substrate-binding protein